MCLLVFPIYRITEFTLFLRLPASLTTSEANAYALNKLFGKKYVFYNDDLNVLKLMDA